jgi:hypothetical protein
MKKIISDGKRGSTALLRKMMRDVFQKDNPPPPRVIERGDVTFTLHPTKGYRKATAR